jgi:hypothetical protein
MATTQNISTNFAGKDSVKYIAPALLGGLTLKGDNCEIFENVVYKHNWKRLNLTSAVQTGAACDFTPAGTLGIDEIVLEPKLFSVPLELCKLNYIDTWEAKNAASVNDMEFTFIDVLMEEVISEVATSVDNAIWNGGLGLSGVTAYALADSTVVDVSAVTLTVSNILDQMERVYVAIPASVRKNKQDIRWFINVNDYAKYELAQNKAGITSNNGAVGVENYLGIKLVPCSITEGEMFVTSKKNLGFATGLLSNHSEVSVLDMKDKDLSNNVRFLLQASAEFRYAWGQDCVLYS